MERDLMDILCCPTCKGDLTLTVTNETGTDIRGGSLRCPRCGMDYPIEEGVPNLLLPDER